jgi:hypothetical protein
MALDGDSLYVADTENHLIRRINLKAKTVQTIAGTGKQSLEYFQTGPARTIALSSPWDLQLIGRTLYIAMAGPHQIWKLDLDKMEVSTFAGSGREARHDGELAESAFAQPSGLTSDGKRLFVSDAESNIVREITLGTNAKVATLAGGDLFDFGDRDGAGNDVRLQHPLGIVWNDGRILIADTYNHKIKQLDPKTTSVVTFLGNGRPGQLDGASASFYEPGGLSVANDKLFVADTNNHAVRVVDLKTKNTSTLVIKGLEPPTRNQADESSDTLAPNLQEIRLETQRVRANSAGSFVVDIGLPQGYHLNPSAPQRYKISIEKGSPSISLGSKTPTTLSATAKNVRLPFRIPVQFRESGLVEATITFSAFYCREDNTGTCQIKTIVWRAPIEVVAQNAAGTEVTATVTIQ